MYLCLENGIPVGYGYLTAYRQGREAVNHVAEVSYYLDFSAHGRHIGTHLLAALEQQAKKQGLKVLIAILVGEQSAKRWLIGEVWLCGMGSASANRTFG
ncbi:MAG: N-acetyltransferase family protein [Oscillospiraceae bacterium]